jgi:hypothetical protein
MSGHVQPERGQVPMNVNHVTKPSSFTFTELLTSCADSPTAVRGQSLDKENLKHLYCFEESCCRALSIVQCFSLKTTFRKLALLPSSGKKGGRGGTYSVGPLERVSPYQSSCCFWRKPLDDGYSSKARFFEMHHSIVRTLQNRSVLFVEYC